MTGPIDPANLNWLDRSINWVAPQWGARRLKARNILKLGDRGYRSTRRTRLRTQRGGGGSPDHHLERTCDRRDLVDNARQLQRNNPIAAGLISRASENIIGCGLRPQAMTEDPRWNAQAEALYKEWAATQADTRRLSSFEELQRLVCMAFLRDGDVGIARRSDGSQQVFISDCIAAPLGDKFDAPMRDGVELDKRGRPVRYHVVKHDNTDVWLTDRRLSSEREIIQAKDFMFLARRNDPDQTRGLPIFAQTEQLFEQLDDLIDSVITAARMAAHFGLVIQAPLGPETGLITETGSDGRDYRIHQFEPGSIRYLEEGETINQIKPEHPSQNFSEFARFLMRIMGVQIGFPLELILLDFSQTNFSSARASLLQAHLTFDCIQKFMEDHWLRPTWGWLVRRWIAEGKLAPRNDAFIHEWIPPGRPFIDPVRELQGHALGMDLGVETLSEILRSQGKDLETWAVKRAAELEKIRDLGVEVRSTMSREPGNGTSNNTGSESGSSPEASQDSQDEDE